jgi:hypothetical protein
MLIEVIKYKNGWTLKYNGSSKYWLELDLGKYWFKYKKDALNKAEELNRSYDLK